MTIEIPDKLYERIGSEAVASRTTPAKWVISIVEKQLAQEDERRDVEFQTAARYVLEKNAELYKRLAQGPPPTRE